MIMLGGLIESLSTRKDKSIKVSIGTQELSPKESAELFQMSQQFCYIAIKPEPFQHEEIDTINSLKTEFSEIKSPSKRLRAILYRNFELNNEGYQDFNMFYFAKMDEICEMFKSNLL
jgi:hypothetical protein